MITTDITCDACGLDIGEGGPHPSWRLVLSADQRPNNSGCTFAVIAHPPIEQDKHFCGLTCLKAWAIKEAA